VLAVSEPCDVGSTTWPLATIRWRRTTLEQRHVRTVAFGSALCVFKPAQRVLCAEAELSE